MARYQDLQCVLDFAASTTNPAQVNVLKLLAEHIRDVWSYNWQQQMDMVDINDLMICARSLGGEEQWVKVFNKEVDFPTAQEVARMLPVLNVHQPALVRKFIEITCKLRPLMSLTRNFAGVLSQPTNTKVSDIERLDLAIGSLQKLNSVVHANTHQDLESPRMVEEVHAAFIRYNWLEKAKEDPKYAKFLEKADNILKNHHVKDHLGRLNPTPRGRRKLSQLMTKMNIKAFDYKSPNQEEAAAIGSDIFQPYHAHYAPQALKEREDFYYLTQYYLTIALVQLKELGKIQEVSVPKFILENYVQLKKVRNILIHNDYLNDSDQAMYTLLTKQICETVYPLNDGLMQLKSDLIKFIEKSLKQDILDSTSSTICTITPLSQALRSSSIIGTGNNYFSWLSSNVEVVAHILSFLPEAKVLHFKTIQSLLEQTISNRIVSRSTREALLQTSEQQSFTERLIQENTSYGLRNVAL